MAKIKVRARALDMLGRQQMASIPNALHELFKNAHDAYADNVEVDFYRAQRLLILRDDGVGMTREDFENRWLTLGTESKLGIEGGMQPPYKDPHKLERPTLGEKGIGRLAIASVGPQALILTRAEREKGLHDLVLCFVNWTLFEIPGISLEEIDIPILTVPKRGKLQLDILCALLQSMRLTVDTLRSRIPERYYFRISSELNAFEENKDKLLSHISNLPLVESRGTAFLIHPVDSILERDIDDEHEDLPSNLLKILRGFSNTMMPHNSPLPLITSFRDHRRDGSVEDIIAAKEFFTPEEFDNADHHFEGFFDEYGQFLGKVKIYREQATEYLVPWDGARGEKIMCGPFSIKVAYLQGNVKESLLPPEKHGPMVQKLNKFGGLYVYRDGIRILPYGSSDFDFLNIERRRTKKAADWYFSYRRMFGAVEITQKDNSTLVEKAGREGFRENKAYRQFKDILENFFKTLALDWFREESATYGKFIDLRNELKKQAIMLEKREKTSRARREVFKEKLDQFFEALENNTPVQETEMIRRDMDVALRHIASLGSDDAAREVLDLESSIRARISDLRDSYYIAKPRSVGLTKSLHQIFERSSKRFADLDESIFKPLEREADEKISALIHTNQIVLNRHKRIREAIDMRGQREIRKAKAYRKEAEEETDTLLSEVLTRSQAGLAKVSEAVKQIMSELERTNLANYDDISALHFQQQLEGKLDSTVTVEIENLERLRNQIQTVIDALRNETPIDETAAALEERLQILKEEMDYYTELAQLGAAIGIIQHEFQSTVNGIRKSINDMRHAATHYPDLRDTYLAMSSNFEHLDTYLAMFTPLNRRLYRKPIKFTGKEIYRYLTRIFGERIKRHQITFSLSAAFEIHSVTGYPATFLPAIINVVDNAIYWLSRNTAGERLNYIDPRIIKLDADEQGFLISNNGPGIEEQDADRIFEMNFSRKLRGRGMGLAISRKALREESFDISLEQIGRKSNPCFRIWTTQVRKAESELEEENADA